MHIPPAIIQKVRGNGKKVSVELMSNHEVVNISRLKAHHGIQWKSFFKVCISLNENKRLLTYCMNILCSVNNFQQIYMNLLIFTGLV